MILIADSGSTKCDWWLVNNGKIIDQFHTQGFNPFFHSVEEIKNALTAHQELHEVRNEIQIIRYLGTGCSTLQKQQKIHTALTDIFQKAEIVVEHDLLGAAYATYNGSPGITGILGTGSNSCFFDGMALSQATPSLGFIMGDEGSGGYFGKKLVIAFAYGWLSDKVANDFKETFKMSVNDLVHRVNSESHANVFLASMMPFIFRHKNDEYISKMLKNGMTEYFTNHILPFKEAKNVPIHFVGSVAHYFKEELTRMAEKHQLTMGEIIQKPGSRVVGYFLKYVF